MMMDDIYFSDPVECPDCHKRCEWGSMIWLKGRCICPECYEKRRRELDQKNGTPVSTDGDLISRDYVEKIIISEVVDLQDGTEEWRTYVNDTCENILNKVHSVPAVNFIISPDYVTELQNINKELIKQLEEAERPQGKWVRTGSMKKRSYQRMCDNCHNIVYFCGKGNYPNCPYCLAEMKGGTE